MKENISSPELTLNIWSNDACRGYVIMAMQDCGFTHKDISRVVNQLYGVFDLYTLNEAEQKYYNGGSICYIPKRKTIRIFSRETYRIGKSNSGTIPG